MEADETKGSAQSAPKDAKEQEQGNTQATEEHQNAGQGRGKPLQILRKERTHAKKARMLQALFKLKGANITQAAQLAGITRQSHYNWCAADPKYKESANNAFQELGDALESVAYQMSMEKNPTALFKTLEAKFKDRGWGDGPQTALQVNTQVNTGELTFDQIKKAAEKVLEAKYGKPQPK